MHLIYQTNSRIFFSHSSQKDCGPVRLLPSSGPQGNNPRLFSQAFPPDFRIHAFSAGFRNTVLLRRFPKHMLSPPVSETHAFSPGSRNTVLLRPFPKHELAPSDFRTAEASAGRGPADAAYKSAGNALPSCSAAESGSERRGLKTIPFPS